MISSYHYLRRKNMKKYEVHVHVEHWMYVNAESKKEATKLALDAVEENSDAVADTDAISDDEIAVCYMNICEEV